MNEKEILYQLNQQVKNTLVEYLGMEFTKVGSDFIEASMPVNNKTINPAQILHGGALMALAETVGSALSYVFIDRSKQDVRGLEINGNHLKSAPIESKVTARASLVHKGKRTHVSEIRIVDENKNLLNLSRMTNMIIDL